MARVEDEVPGGGMGFLRRHSGIPGRGTGPWTPSPSAQPRLAGKVQRPGNHLRRELGIHTREKGYFLRGIGVLRRENAVSLGVETISPREGGVRTEWKTSSRRNNHLMLGDHALSPTTQGAPTELGRAD